MVGGRVSTRGPSPALKGWLDPPPPPPPPTGFSQARKEKKEKRKKKRESANKVGERKEKCTVLFAMFFFISPVPYFQ
jgi:hypothetical protein